MEASNTETAQSKDVWNENLKFLMRLVICLLLAVCLLFAILADIASLIQGKVARQEKLHIFMIANCWFTLHLAQF